MAIKKNLLMMIMGPKMDSKKEDKAEKLGKKGFPKQSVKEEKLELKPFAKKGSAK